MVIPDLRGHGDSAKPGHYALPQFVYDLHRVIHALGLQRPAILGHSLGGHVVTRFAAQFPDQASRLIIAEGLGPPLRPQDERYDGPNEGARLLATMDTPRRMRPLPSIAFAAERLIANNPRLAATHALWLAQHSTDIDERGERHWKFDPRVAELWLGADHAHNESRWQQIEVPVLVVTAELAHEYWLGQMPIPGWSGRFTDDDLNRRLRCFRNAEHVHLEDAGHMVHFDQPVELAKVTRAFLT
ncbi:MAG: alpha/beta hydrolase [Gammaproteobacteria bacterium]|nr:alpha/beta hydrolase [Gammaproteobacteria bacterium]